jgi:phage terminase small subunit
MKKDVAREGEKPALPELPKVTAKQQMFVNEYLIDLNATQAAIRAGYSAKSADKIGAELLGKTGVYARVTRAMAERSRRTEITADRVLIEMARIGLVNISDIVDLRSGDLRKGIAPDDTAAIQTYKVRRYKSEAGEQIEREIRLYDKRPVLLDLAKHVGLTDDKIKLEGDLKVVKFEGATDDWSG